MTKKRLSPADRKQQILNAAIEVAARPGGWSKLTRDAVAKEAGCAEGLVSKYFGTMIAFRRSIMLAAIRAENLAVIAQGLATGNECAQKVDESLKRKALETLAG